jgi:hypothetical protein
MRRERSSAGKKNNGEGREKEPRRLEESEERIVELSGREEMVFLIA